MPSSGSCKLLCWRAETKDSWESCCWIKGTVPEGCWWKDASYRQRTAFSGPTFQNEQVNALGDEWQGWSKSPKWTHSQALSARNQWWSSCVPKLAIQPSQRYCSLGGSPSHLLVLRSRKNVVQGLVLNHLLLCWPEKVGSLLSSRSSVRASSYKQLAENSYKQLSLVPILIYKTICFHFYPAFSFLSFFFTNFQVLPNYVSRYEIN